MRLDFFDHDQLAAIEGDSDRFVIACPGSGKTRVALGKIIDDGEKQSLKGGSVLALAFAVGAKSELEKRIDAKAGPSLRRSISVNTIHGFVLKQLIAPFGQMIAGRPLRLAQAGGLAFRAAIAETSRIHNVNEVRFFKLFDYSRRTVDGVAWKNASPLPDAAQMILKTFWDALLTSGHVDYANALYIGATLLDQYNWIREGIAATYPTIVVDEYQDCTDIQLTLLRLLKKGGSRICLVGDPYQCVFEFIGADLKALYDFTTEIGAERKPLQDSYRCPQNVLDIAERIFPRGIKPAGEAARKTGDTTISQGDNVIGALNRFVSKCVGDGIDQSEIAFVTAYNDRLNEIITALNDEGIPTTHGRLRRDDADWFAFLVDTMLLSSPPSTEYDFEQLTQALVDVIGRFASAVLITKETSSTLETAAGRIAFESAGFPNQSIVELFPEIIRRAMWIFESSNTVRAYDLEVIHTELKSASAFYANKPIAQTTSAAKRVEELRPVGKVRGYNYLNIKGLEFEAVAVVDVGGMYMPDYKSGDYWADLRRLYVAVTRSKRHLLIHTTNVGDSKFLPIITGEKSAEEVIQKPNPVKLFDGSAYGSEYLFAKSTSV